MHYVITFLMTRLLLVCIFLCLQYLKRNRSFKLIFMGIIINEILLLPWQLFCIFQYSFHCSVIVKILLGDNPFRPQSYILYMLNLVFFFSCLTNTK